MNFSSPNALWLLTLAVPVTAAHFYRGKRRRVAVPSLLFWDAVLVDEVRSSALRRLSHHFSLLLVLVALAAMAAALSGPDTDSWRAPPRKVVVVVDTGPELLAGGRLQEAISGARELLSRLGRRDEAALLDRSGVVEAMTRDKQRILGALRKFPRDLPRQDRDGLLAMAERLGGSLYVFSALPGPQGVPVGRPMDNVALGALALSPGPPPLLRVAVSGRTRSRGATTLVLRDRGEIIGRKSVELDPRESKTVEWPVDARRLEAGLRVDCSIDPPEDYADDDRCTLVTPPLLPPLVAVVSGGDSDPHLSSALDLLARDRIIRLHHAATAADVPASATVRIFDGVEAPPGLSGGVMIVGAPTGRRVEAPHITDWVRDAPFHRDVDYSDVRLKRACIVEGEPLILSDQGPVASWSSRMGGAVIRFGFRFRIDDGDIALRPAFPILLRGAIAWLDGEGTRAFPSATGAGGVLVNLQPLSIAEGSARVTTLRGSSMEMRSWPVHESKVRIDVPLPALLKVEAGREAEWVAVNGSSPDIVDLSEVSKDPGPAFPARIPWWQDLPFPAMAGGLALLLLVVEWLLYHRGE